MEVKKFAMAWIVVKNLKSAIQFYTEVLGMKLVEKNEEFGWAEVAGSEEGARLGLAQENEMEKIRAGQNAIITLNVDNIDTAKKELSKKGTRMVGEIIEIPGHVKMQMCVDGDGNHFQITEMMSEK